MFQLKVILGYNLNIGSETNVFLKFMNVLCLLYNFAQNFQSVMHFIYFFAFCDLQKFYCSSLKYVEIKTIFQ